MKILSGTPIEVPVSAALRASRLRTAVRAGATDGAYVCIVIVQSDGTTATVCERVK